MGDSRLMNVQLIARANTAWMQAPPASRMTCYFLAVALFGVVLSMSLLYLVVGGIVMLLR